MSLPLNRWSSGLSAVQAVVSVLLLMLSLTVQAQNQLPDMGEPADNALSPLEERAIGAQLMRSIRAQLPLVRDVQSEEYIQALGSRLALASGKTNGQAYTFFIINEDTINAFAIPGGYIGVNVGLIDAMQFEDQLASVVAHEVAHVTQRHHARTFATGRSASLSAAAAVLAAILIGQASPEAGQAALAAGIAATQQSAINFTRTNEIEADRIGIEILANAGFNPHAMAETFAIMQRKNRLNTSGAQIEYLRTHPLDNNRIAEAKDRAQSSNARGYQPQIDFELFSARLGVLTTRDSAQLLRAHQAKFKRQRNAGSAYAIALLNFQANRLNSADSALQELDKIAPGHPMAAILKAEILEARGQSTKSRDALQDLLELYPNKYSIVEKLVEHLIRVRRHTDAMDVALYYLRNADNPSPRAWRQLANIQQRLGNQAGSHESLARYYEGFDELGRAVGQLELALRHVAPGSKDDLRLRASLKALQGGGSRR
ncbi:MAG: M48 family metalloprotease [Gammaproteobacteria bacterium]|nr:M48 family metalloprotease [Gammaproteobacteria bacterium]